MEDLKINFAVRAAIFAAIILYGWYALEQDIRETCGDNEACIEASL